MSIIIKNNDTRLKMTLSIIKTTYLVPNKILMIHDEK